MRPPRTLRRTIAALASSFVLAGAGIGWSAQAKATDDELVYLQLLNMRGITIHDTATAITIGYAVCDALNTASGEVVAYNLASMAPLLTLVDARWVVLSAAEALCPWQFRANSGGTTV